LAMNPVGIVLLIAHTRDSFTIAGLASASYTLTGAVFGPRIGQLADRFGTRQVIVPISLINILSILSLVHFSTGSTVGILISAGVAGASFPNIGSFTRTRWGRALHGVNDNRELNTALSMEAILDEIAFVVGPALAGILYSLRSPAFALETALVFLLVGSLGLAKTSGAHDIAADRDKRHGGLLSILDVKSLLLSLVCMGIVFGGNTVAILSAAKEGGHAGRGGILVAIYSIGSLVAGGLYGLRHWKSSLSFRYFLGLLLMTLATSGILFFPNLSTLPYFLILSGVAISPVLIAANALIKTLVPSDRLNEAFSYLGAAISIGITIGSAVGGSIVSNFDAWRGFYFVTAASATATVIALIGLVHYQTRKKVIANG
jgi:MFS family permease